MRWRLRSCPRCGGDIFIDKDLFGGYEKCLQCGYCTELRRLDEFGHHPSRKDKEAVGHQDMK
ncbi:MAG: hypothetical protein PHN78_06195 [Dehalococcoidales bacterium]|nr:hypothetical protein [Dehalococcoidales bacterium]